MQPSHGILPVEDYIASFRYANNPPSASPLKSCHLTVNGRQFDVPTFFSRNIKTAKMFADQWYGDRLPKTVAVCV